MTSAIPVNKYEKDMVASNDGLTGLPCCRLQQWSMAEGQRHQTSIYSKRLTNADGQDQ